MLSKREDNLEIDFILDRLEKLNIKQTDIFNL